MADRPTDSRRRLGAWGEKVAAVHLEAAGYLIVERNWRCREGEIDLVAQDGDIVVFVEVKTRRDAAAAHAAVHPHQLRRVARAAAAFRARRADAAGVPRIDVMLVWGRGLGRRVRWVRGVEADDAAT